VPPGSSFLTALVSATSVSDNSALPKVAGGRGHAAAVLTPSVWLLSYIQEAYRSVWIMAIRKILLPLISTTAGEAALSTAWTIAQPWNAHLMVLHVQMDLAPAYERDVPPLHC
jgi:hypothetical protein